MTVPVCATSVDVWSAVQVDNHHYRRHRHRRHRHQSSSSSSSSSPPPPSSSSSSSSSSQLSSPPHWTFNMMWLWVVLKEHGQLVVSCCNRTLYQWHGCCSSVIFSSATIQYEKCNCTLIHTAFILKLQYPYFVHVTVATWKPSSVPYKILVIN